MFYVPGIIFILHSFTILYLLQLMANIVDTLYVKTDASLLYFMKFIMTFNIQYICNIIIIYINIYSGFVLN